LQDLTGVRVWLSGSVPEVSGSTEEERASVLRFVRDFSAKVFKLGGHIIHGSHPSFVPVLLEEAARHRANGGRTDCLTLVVSRYWSKDDKEIPTDEWRRTCLVYETPEATGQDARNESLKILRQWMAARCDAIVVAGGRWWHEVAGQAGVPIEISLALERGISSFLVGGLGGAARDFIDNHPALLRRLKNGLSEGENASLCIDTNAASVCETVCSQLSCLPLVRGKASESVSFRILALDGGGIKGTFTAAALATWEKQTSLRIVDHFDLIAGTSTGGILAIGLGLGLSAMEMLEFYKQRGRIIFPVTSVARRFKSDVRHFFRPKYSQAILLRELEAAYYKGGSPIVLRDSECRLVIPAYHAIAGVSHVFRTPHNPLLTGDAGTQAAHAALATAAAPTFFSAAKVGNMIAETSFFDGGVWANSPAMTALVESACYLNIPLDRVDVLSVGTTDEPFTVRRQLRSGIIRWNVKLLKLLMNVQSESSLRQAKSLAGQPRFLRVDAITVPGSYTLDDSRQIGELASLGNREAEKPEVLAQVKSRFLNGVFVSPWEHFG
jgi:predicted acylesterase/phospholipase RssA